MFNGFKSLSSTHQQNMIANIITLAIVWLFVSTISDFYLLNSNNPIAPDVKNLGSIEKTYIVDGKTYTLRQQVKLIDGVLNVGKIEDVK